jgi:hypothetical protein
MSRDLMWLKAYIAFYWPLRHDPMLSTWARRRVRRYVSLARRMQLAKGVSRGC